MSDGPAANGYPYWRRNRIVFPVANLLCGIGFSLAWPFVPLMLRGMGVGENLAAWVGYTLLAFYLVGFALNPVWGSLADHYGRKLMVLRAMLGMGIAMAFVPLAPDPTTFALLLVLVGAFNGYTPAGVALLVANTPPERLGRTVSLAQTGGFVGMAAGPALGGMLAAVVDPLHALFWVSGAFMVSGGLLVAAWGREVKQRKPGAWRLEWIASLRELLGVPRIGALLLFSFLFAVMWHGSVTNVTLFTVELLSRTAAKTGDEALWVGAVAAALAVSMMVAMPAWGHVIDRIGPARVLVVSVVATILTHLPLLVLETPLQLVAARAAFGLMAAAMPTAIFQLLKQHAPPGMDARAIAYATSFHFLAMALAPFTAGLIAPHFGLRAYFALTIVLMAGGLVVWRWADTRAKAAGATLSA